MDRAARVGSLPHAHPYVDAVLADAGVRRVPPRGGPGLAGAVADPGDVDVLLLHFGYEGHPLAELEALLARAARCGTPVATVVHDLENPHLLDQAPHVAALDAVLRAAGLVVTLSRHAAAELARRWGVTAHVLPHPLLVPAARPPRPRAPGPARVGVHLKSLRRNLLATEAVAALCALRRRHPDVEATAWLHTDARVGTDPAGGSTLGAALATAPAAGVEVVRHERLDHPALLDRVEQLDVLLLPYRHGTHSGLLDVARDLGTATVAPATGAYREQGATATFDPTSSHLVTAMADALLAALSLGPPAPRDLAARAAASRRDSRRLGDALRGLARGRALPTGPSPVGSVAGA